MSYVSAHVLDASTGTPAAGVTVELASAEGESIATERTDADGRVTNLGPDSLDAGRYEITFGSGEYFAGRGFACFYPRVTVTFAVEAHQPHYHVPLLLSPFSYTTYRGS